MTDELSRENAALKRACDLYRIESDALRMALARELSTWCDKPEDRMYHAEDETWWRRDAEGNCVAADPPPGLG